ncbi:Hint domain-containing protein [Bacteriovorax sp. DB6_IX]|uniref:Hint domain-containing protein n=1 Tax=Bacteriovorax sp. DB6_IX TaxID=1353530 RepID=UPI000389F1F9|nr:Hint domain-containing protein [Bacteriovorax sp. DB6_IX]EQC50981.1 intein N-terminal splicing domain protein [Bacteriovorax sp. DB6_IX]
MKKQLLVTTMLLSHLSSMAAGGFAEARCAAWGDNLNQPQAKERMKWAMTCDPANRRLLYTYRTYTAPDGSKRPAYPIYGLPNEDFTKDPSNPLKWYPPKSANADCYIPEGYDIIGFCASGCYTADQLIQTGNGEYKIANMLNNKMKSVTTLDKDSSLSDLRTKEGEVLSYMKSIVDGEHRIIIIETESGKRLEVTEEHPLVLASGHYADANQLKVGSKLLSELGEVEVITKLSEKQYHGKVFNLRTKGSAETDRVIVAGGLLNGDLTVQQRTTNRANQHLLRTKLVRGELLK